MEYLWQVDEDDKPVGKVERNKAHAYHILHRAGIVFLLKGDEVYLTARSPTKRIFPSCYEASANFHVAYGESYEEAAKRKAKEELGLELELKMVGKFRHSDGPEEQWVGVFVGKHPGGEITLDDREAVSGRFYSVDEVREIIAMRKVAPWLRDGWKLAEPILCRSG